MFAAAVVLISRERGVNRSSDESDPWTFGGEMVEKPGKRGMLGHPPLD